MTRVSLLAAAMLTASTASLPANAKPHRPAFLPLGPIADAPNGFTELCQRDLNACRGAKTAGTTVELPPMLVPADQQPVAEPFHSAAIVASLARPAEKSPAARAATDMWHLVDRVNRRVNRRVLQRSDLVRFGVEERWERTGTGKRAIGDCEDIALEKQAELIAAGVPASRLFLATVYHPGVGLHTVLLARLDRGDVILDSLTTRIDLWYRARYTWLRVQSPDDPLAWHQIASV